MKKISAILIFVSLLLTIVYAQEIQENLTPEEKLLIQDSPNNILLKSRHFTPNIGIPQILKDKITAILLFGSHVKGIVTKRSDIDICIIFDKISKEEANKFRIHILGHFSSKMDMQVFNILPQKIKRSIARNHKILYKNEKFDNISFTIRYLKDEDYFIRMNRIFAT